jgi:hypothetical protein
MPPPPVPSPLQKLAAIITLVALAAIAGCQPAPTTRPVPSVAQIGGEFKCLNGDHGFSDLQAGWGFCYPGTWKYQERSQASLNPPGLDLTFDVTDVPCTTPSAAPGAASARPECSPGAGLFAFMIISTYQRGSASNLAAWQQTYFPAVTAGQSINWGNAIEAIKLPDGRRMALTPHHVVILELRSGQGSQCVTQQGTPTPCYLDLDAHMSPRLNTWKFSL